MRLLDVLVLISSISFLVYGISCLTSSKIKSEFIRFGLKKFDKLIGVLEIVGALGLLVGLLYNFILVISAGGLALLMFLGVAVRLKVSDGLLAMLPALFFLVLNSYIFLESMKILSNI
jgi:hypothetical protein